MPNLHTFGCSITQGFALPDVVKPILDSNGEPLPEHEVQKLMDSGSASWTDIHLYQPSDHAWPKVLADKLGVPVNNYACLLYTSPSPRDKRQSLMPSSA